MMQKGYRIFKFDTLFRYFTCSNIDSVFSI